MQEWLNLARDGVSRLRLTLPLVTFFGWLARLTHRPEDGVRTDL
jgi:hypothetical protein